MTPPAFFAVAYAINPWMDVTAPVDVQVAQAQWEHLHQTYLRLGHSVDLIEPISGLPDMVYTANGGFIAHDIAVVARFRFPERAGESRAYASWMSSVGYRPVTTRHVNEGQGDLLMVGERVLAGYGFRTDQRAHAEIAAVLGLPVVSSSWSTHGSITWTPRWPCSTTTRSPTTRRRSVRQRRNSCRRCSPTRLWSAVPTRSCSDSTPSLTV